MYGIFLGKFCKYEILVVLIILQIPQPWQGILAYIYALRPGQSKLIHASSTAEVKLCFQVYVCPRVPRLQCSLHHRGVQGLRQ